MRWPVCGQSFWGSVVTTVIGALCVGKPSDVKVSLASEVRSIWAILLRFSGDYRLMCAMCGQSFLGSVVTTVGLALCEVNPSGLQWWLPSEVRCVGNPSDIKWRVPPEFRVWAILLMFSGDYPPNCALCGQSFLGSVVTTVGGALCVGNPYYFSFFRVSVMLCKSLPNLLCYAIFLMRLRFRLCLDKYHSSMRPLDPAGECFDFA